MTNAFDIPSIGLGTCSKKGDIGPTAMRDALELGYRHIDSAQGYKNEQSVGQAIAESGVPRSEVFITTKISRANLGRDRLGPSLRESLDRLRTDQVDLTLIHWPGQEGDPPLGEYMEALARAREDGLTRFIGASNFTRALIDQAVDVVGPGVFANNQVEVHPFLQNRKLRDHCAAHGIRVTAYMPIAGGLVVDDPVIVRIAAAHGATPAQVSIAWLLQEGMVAIPCSSQRARIEENFNASQVRLNETEMAEIGALDRGQRIIAPAIGPDWD